MYTKFLPQNGSKVVVGSQLGVVLLFSWGHWLDTTDRFPGHNGPINTMVALDEDTIITGCEDGVIRYAVVALPMSRLGLISIFRRIVNILPNKMIGVVGSHRRMPIENMAISRDKSFLASAADNSVKFWNISFMFDEEEEGEGDEDGESDNADLSAFLTGKADSDEGDAASGSADSESEEDGDSGEEEGDVSEADSDEEEAESSKKRKRAGSDEEEEESHPTYV